MTSQWLLREEDAKRLEPLNGARPYAVQAVHPAGGHAALEVPVPGSESIVAVWEIATGKRTWMPRDAFAITWSRDGGEVFVAGDVRSYDQGFLRRYSWPALQLTREGSAEMEGYRFSNIAVSPAGLLAVSSIDQGETYVYVYDIGDASNWPRLVARWEDRASNLINGLEFTPDGAALVWTLGSLYYWWSSDDEPGPSRGGRFTVGRIFRWNIAHGSPRDVSSREVLVDVPAGWSAEDPEDIICSQMLQGPFFESPGSLRILLPTGEWRTYSYDLKELPDRSAGKTMRVRDVATVDLQRALRGA